METMVFCGILAYVGFFGNFCNFIMFYLAGQLEMYLFILNMSVEKPK